MPSGKSSQKTIQYNSISARSKSRPSSCGSLRYNAVLERQKAVKKPCQRASPAAKDCRCLWAQTTETEHDIALPCQLIREAISVAPTMNGLRSQSDPTPDAGDKNASKAPIVTIDLKRGEMIRWIFFYYSLVFGHGTW